MPPALLMPCLRVAIVYRRYFLKIYCRIRFVWSSLLHTLALPRSFRVYALASQYGILFPLPLLSRVLVLAATYPHQTCCQTRDCTVWNLVISPPPPSYSASRFNLRSTWRFFTCVLEVLSSIARISFQWECLIARSGRSNNLFYCYFWFFDSPSAFPRVSILCCRQRTDSFHGSVT